MRKPGCCRRSPRAAKRESDDVVLRAALIGAIRFYQKFISPLFPPRCRFYPTCSSYAAEALDRHGVLRGSWLTIRRLSKCHPWHPGGYDPVP